MSPFFIASSMAASKDDTAKQTQQKTPPTSSNKPKPLSTNPTTLATVQKQTPPAAQKPVTVTPAEPQEPRPLVSDANIFQEYVSGGLYSWLATYYRALPHYIDDATSEFGDDLYDRMMLDSKVAACVNILKLAVLAQGITVISAVTEEGDDNYEKAQEVADFCKRALNNLKRPNIVQTAWQLLDALPYGNKIAELTWEIKQTGEDKGKYIIKMIKPKPRHVTAMVVDAYQNVVGVLGLLPGQGPASLLTAGLIGVSEQQPDTSNAPANLLPRDKFVILSWRPKDNDPRGTSILRAAYDPWWFKQQCKPEYLAYLARFGSPSLVGKTPKDALPMVYRDANGNTLVDPTSPTGVKMVTPEQVLLTQLLSFKNGTALAVPGETEIDWIESSGDGDAFNKALDFANREISQAILHQTLATDEARFQAKASSDNHQDVLSLVIRDAKEALSKCLEQDVLYQLVAYNYGPDVADELCPTISLAEMERADFAVNATAIATLFSSGYLHESQLPELDSMLGLPERDLEQIQREQEQAQQMAMAIAQGQGPQPGENGETAQAPAGTQSTKQNNIQKTAVNKAASAKTAQQPNDTASQNKQNDKQQQGKNGETK